MIVSLSAACGCAYYCSSCFGVVFTKIVDALANDELY